MILAKFFEYMPKGEYSMLNLAHILIIVFGLVGILIACFFLRKLEHKKVEKILIVCAIIALTLDPIYWIWELVVTKSFDFSTTLPLYFCSLFFIVLNVAVFSKKQAVKQTCYAYLATFNIFAGLMGLILNNNLNNYPVLSFVGVRTIVYHLLMLFVSCLIWFTGYYKPQIKDTFRFFIPLAILFIPALIVDKIWNWDYCYLNGGRGTPIENVSRAMPNAVYIILLYILVIVAVNVVFYIPTIVKYYKSKRGEKKIETK